MSAKAALAAILVAIPAAPALAQGFYLPVSTPSAGQDEFRASDGTTCRSTMDGTKRVEVGTFATGTRTDAGSNYNLPGHVSVTPAQGNMGVYGRFAWSLDATPSRIDCNKLYQLELEKRQLEVEMMKRSLSVAERQLDEAKAKPARKTRGGQGGPPL